MEQKLLDETNFDIWKEAFEKSFEIQDMFYSNSY